MGSKVKTKANFEGLFVIPIQKLIGKECFDGIDIAHQSADYHNIRYDFEDAPVQAYEDLTWYEFNVPSNDGDLAI